MIRGAIWWLEQWHKANKPFYHFWDDSPEGQVGGPVFAMMTGIAPAIGIAVSPYGQLQRRTIALESYVAREAWSKGSPFVRSTPKGLIFGKRFTHSAGKRLILKGGAKLGARAIPYLGWALLVVDAWMVGKWIGEQTSPF